VSKACQKITVRGSPISLLTSRGRQQSGTLLIELFNKKLIKFKYMQKTVRTYPHSFFSDNKYSINQLEEALADGWRVVMCYPIHHYQNTPKGNVDYTINEYILQKEN
jgi:hypothetical protein